MKNTHIEWASHTFNPWEGCTKISPGCLHCYAETRNIRFAGGKNWGKGAPRRRTTAANWRQPIQWNLEALRLRRCSACGWQGPYEDVCPTPDCLTFGSEMESVRPRVFCASLADWLDNEVPIEWLTDLLMLVHQTKHLDWLMLSKRPHLWRSRLRAAQDKLYNVGSIPRDCANSMVDRWLAGEAPSNVWLGTTVEDQSRADERVPLLLSIPAKVRFLSCEPLLESVILKPEWLELELQSFGNRAHFFPRIDWVICGGESGRESRPMHPDWARSLRDQCAASEVPFLFKQWGEYLPDDQRAADGTIADELGCPEQLVHLGGPRFAYRIGKRAAGRLLGGVEHNGIPIV